MNYREYKDSITILLLFTITLLLGIVQSGNGQTIEIYRSEFIYQQVRPNGTSIGDNTYGIPILGTDDLRFSTGAYMNDAEHMGKSLTLNGTTQYASRADEAATSITDQLTLEAWVKLDVIGAEYTIVGKWDETTANDDRSYRLYINSSNYLVFAVSTDGAAVVEHTGTTTALAANYWYHVAATFNSSDSMNVYVNGVRDATVKTASVPASIDDNASPLYVGTHEGTGGTVENLLDGQIDELRIFDTTIFDVDSISNDYKATYEPQQQTNVVAWFPFNSNLLDTTAANIDLTDNGTVTYSANYLVSPKERELLNPNQWTLSFWVKPNWDWSAGGVEYFIFMNNFNTPNRIELEKTSSDYLRIIYEVGDVQIIGQYIPTWVAGTWYKVDCVFSKNSIDGTDYLQLYENGVEKASSTTTPGYVQGVEATSSIGNYNGTLQFDGSLHGRIYNIPLPVTKANAITAGLDSIMSIAGLYEAGEGYDIPVNENILYKFPVERDEVSIKTMSNFKAWMTTDALVGTGQDSITVSAADAVVLNAWADKFPGDSVRVLLGNWATYDSEFYAFETAVMHKDSINTTSGIIVFDEMTNEANFTTAKNSFLSVNLIYDGDAEMYGVGWTGWTAGMDIFKDFTDVKTGSQSFRLKSGGASNAADMAIDVVASENYYLSAWFKSASAGHRTQIITHSSPSSWISDDFVYKEKTDWYNYNVAFEIPSGVTSMATYIYVEADGDIANFDNLILMQIPNKNGGMEEPLATDYSIIGTPDTLRDNTAERSGTYAMKLWNSTSANYVYTEITPVLGEYYTISGYGKATAGDILNIQIVNNTDSTQIMTVDETAFRQFSKTIKSNGTKLRVKFYNSVTGDTTYIDDLSLTPLKKDEASTNTPSSYSWPLNRPVIFK
jgi:hypothetical protein